MNRLHDLAPLVKVRGHAHSVSKYTEVEITVNYNITRLRVREGLCMVRTSNLESLEVATPWSLGRWDRGFESRSRNGWLSSSFWVVQSGIGRGLCDGPIPLAGSHTNCLNRLKKPTVCEAASIILSRTGQPDRKKRSHLYCKEYLTKSPISQQQFKCARDKRHLAISSLFNNSFQQLRLYE